MNRRVLKKVCQFLQSQKDNEAHFSHFWENTKDFYPEDQSKTKVRKWLQEHPDRLEFIAGNEGNPYAKIRLKVSGGESDVSTTTTRKEDEEIISKLVEAIDKQEDGILFAVLCAQKSDFFPSQLQDKKVIRKWLNDREDYFEMLTDQNGGLYSVRVTQKARQSRGQKARGERKPKKGQEVVSVDRVQETSSTLEKVKRFLERNDGSVSFDLLVQQKGLFPENLRERGSIRSFLTNFPADIQLIDSLNIVVLIKSQSSREKGKKVATSHLPVDQPQLRVPMAPIPSQPNMRREFQKNRGPAQDKVINFICENGGTVSFAVILKEAGELIHKGINNNDALFVWLASNGDHFDMFPNPNGTPYGQVIVKLNITPRFCQSYVTAKICPKANCEYLHICKAFVCGQEHSEDICNQSHNIRDQHNSGIINQSAVLRRCPDHVVTKILLKSCFPRVCSEFNKNKQGMCPRNEKCYFLHICGDFVLNQCFGSCSLSHNMVDGMHNIELLKKYALLPSPKLSTAMVKTNIACVQIQNPAFHVRSNFPPNLMNMPIHVNSPPQKGAKKKSRSRPRRRKKVDFKPSESSTSESESNSSSSHKETLSSPIQQTSNLKAGNIEQSKLNTSLSGYEKVESWMSSASACDGHNDPQVNQLSRERSQSSSSSEGSVQSSVVSSQNSFQLTELEEKVFMRLLDKYYGSALFSQIAKDDLFPAYFDVSKWFEEHPNTFTLHFNGRRQVERVNVFSRRCRLCLDYSSKKGCTNQDCHYFHICRNLIEGNCSSGDSCTLNHSTSDEVKQLAKCMKLEHLTDAQLCKVLQLSTPSVCTFHNKGHCNRGVNCPNIHICQRFTRGRCHPHTGNGCRFGHLEALETPQAKKLLEQYQMEKQKPNYIRKMLFVFSEKKSDAPMKKSDAPMKGDVPMKSDAPMKSDVTAKVDPKEKSKAEQEHPIICSQFLAGKCPLGKKCKDIHNHMPYSWQFQIVENPSSKWFKFNENEGENIEKLFCDVNCNAAELTMATKIPPQSSIPHCSVQLNFQTMSGSIQHPSSEEATKFHLRRLESSRRKLTEAGDWFDTQWMWYKLDADSHKWIKFEMNKSSALEESYLDGIIQIDSPSLRRRPAVFVSKSEVQERKKRDSADQAVVSEKPSPVTTDITGPNSDPVMNSSQLSSPSSMAPASNQCYRVKVEHGTQDYHIIEKLLRDSVGEEELDINNLEKLKNDSLWSKYISKKKLMTDELDPGESVNERHLFMPCRYDDVDRIMKDNVYVSRLDLPDLFGPGHYFTSNASLCLNWCTENSTQSRFLLVCQVLLGTYTEGSPGNQARPRRVNGKFYDSLVNKITEPTVFAVSDVDQCYPAYIIDFSSNINVSTPAVGEVSDPVLRSDTRDAGRRTSGTQSGVESPMSPTVPGYPSYPVSQNQDRRPVVPTVDNHPLSYPAVAPQHVPQFVPVSSGVQSLANEPRGSVVSSHVPVGHASDCVKAPPPYSERPTSSEQVVTSEIPPSYSDYRQPESAGFARPAAAMHPVPPQPATRAGSRPGVTKKDKDCVVM